MTAPAVQPVLADRPAWQERHIAVAGLAVADSCALFDAHPSRCWQTISLFTLLFYLTLSSSDRVLAYLVQCDDDFVVAFQILRLAGLALDSGDVQIIITGKLL